MNKGTLKGLIICLMIIAVILVVVFIIKSNTEDYQGDKSTVVINNSDDYIDDTYIEAKTDDNIIDYAHDHYFAIILVSSLSFFGLLIFYAFISKKKEW